MAGNGLFITLEGPEGAGKSTQLEMLGKYLESKGHDVLVTREPGGTPLGEKVRELIKHFGGPGAVCDNAELLLFGACRAQLIDKVIAPHLEKGGTVLCDRFIDSTTVYQGMARKLPIEFIYKMHELTVKSFMPDLTIVVDVDTDTGFGRVRNRSGKAEPADRIEAESRDFHEMVRNGFLSIAKDYPERIKVVSGIGSIEDIHTNICAEVNCVL